MAQSNSTPVIMRLVLPVLLFAPGCSLWTSRAPMAEDEPELEGVWDGVSVNDCGTLMEHETRCRAVHSISLTILGVNAKMLSGFYHCAPGTTPCYNRVESGVVNSGVIKGLQFRGRSLSFRIMRDDHSSCLFNTIPSSDRMRGGFYCSGVERGFWQVERAY